MSLKKHIRNERRLTKYRFVGNPKLHVEVEGVSGETLASMLERARRLEKPRHGHEQTHDD